MRLLPNVLKTLNNPDRHKEDASIYFDQVDELFAVNRLKIEANKYSIVCTTYPDESGNFLNSLSNYEVVEFIKYAARMQGTKEPHIECLLLDEHQDHLKSDLKGFEINECLDQLDEGHLYFLA